MTQQSINVEGVEYAVSQFSPAVQQAVGIYNTVATDLQKAQLEVIKCQAAMQNIGSQITAAVKEELAAKTTESANEPTVE